MRQPQIVREGPWEGTVRTDDSGNSEYCYVAREEGLCAIIDCIEIHHRRDAEVTLDIVAPNGMHVKPERPHHFHETDSSLTVLAKVGGYVKGLMGEIGTNIGDYLSRK